VTESPTCPGCAATTSRPAFLAVNRREGLDARGSYVKCTDCGTLRLDGAPSGEDLSAAYATGEIDPVGEQIPSAADRNPPAQSLPASLARHVRRAIFGRPHSWPEEEGNGRRLLDFGCLDGSKLVDFYQRGWEVAGVDLNRAGIDRARSRLPGAFFHAGPIEALAPEERFDVIRTDNVLEHIPQPREIIAHLRTRLRPNGRLFAYVPSGESLSVRLFHDRSVSVWVPYHLSLFSREGLGRLFTRAGFSNVSVLPFTPPDWWKITARQLVAKPGYLSKPATPIERVALLAEKLASPALLALSRTSLAEEWVVVARD